MTSQTLENIYLADRDTEIPFSAGKHQYVFRFKDEAGKQLMYQENIKFKTKREVRRRPRFVCTQAVEDKLKRYSDFHLRVLFMLFKYFGFWYREDQTVCVFSVVLHQRAPARP